VVFVLTGIMNDSSLSIFVHWTEVALTTSNNYHYDDNEDCDKDYELHNPASQTQHLRMVVTGNATIKRLIIWRNLN